MIYEIFARVPLLALKLGSLFAPGIAIFMLTLSVFANSGSFIARLVTRYISWMERRLRLMFIFMPGIRILWVQGAASFFALVLWVLFDLPWPLAWIGAIIAAPAVWITLEQKKRLEAIDEQLDSVILALANALKSTSSIQSAFNSIVSVVANPMQQEIDLAIKEMKVGSSLDQALLHMAARIGSRQVDSALSAILIGRQVGGNLPKVLENTANSLREMRRLEGTIRTKTADGRFQLYVIGAMPLVFIGLISYLMPGFFKPLGEPVAGWVLSVVIVGCWVASIVTATKVLQVDI
jgi:tight adherence protein B